MNIDFYNFYNAKASLRVRFQFKYDFMINMRNDRRLQF
jgi:hypothetical protein